MESSFVVMVRGMFARISSPAVGGWDLTGDIGSNASLFNLLSLLRTDLVLRAWPQTRHP